jgi:hypothetical protein
MFHEERLTGGWETSLCPSDALAKPSEIKQNTSQKRPCRSSGTKIRTDSLVYAVLISRFLDGHQSY